MTKEVDQESFFNFFKTSENNDDKDADDDSDRIQIDLDIGKNLVDELIPYHLEYYLGVKVCDDDDFEDIDDCCMDEDE